MGSRKGGRKNAFVEVDRGRDRGYILSIGPMSVWITARTGRAIVAALSEALESREEATEDDARRESTATVVRRAN